MESLAVICLPCVFSVTALFLCELSHCLAVWVTFHPNRAGGDGGLFPTNFFPLFFVSFLGPFCTYLAFLGTF